MKTFAIFPVADMTIEGKAFTPADQVGVVSVDESVSMMTLLGMIQFGRCNAVELDFDQIIAESEELSGLIDEEDQPLEAMPDQDAPPLDDQPEEGEPFFKPAEEVEPIQEVQPTPPAKDGNPFLTDGLDENIAEILHGQSLTPDAIRSMIAEGFDLTDLTGIGKTRAAQITAIYGK